MIKSGLSSKSASDVPSAVLTCSLHTQTQFTRRVNPAAPVHRSKLVLASVSRNARDFQKNQPFKQRERRPGTPRPVQIKEKRSRNGEAKRSIVNNSNTHTHTHTHTHTQEQPTA
jgi:hypothetical protein